MSLILSHPWLVIVCILAAVIPACFLYRNSFFQHENKRLAWVLGILRFIAFFVLLFLLLQPLIKTTQTRVEKPIVVVLADNSLSVVSGNDSVQVKKQLPAQISQTVQALQNKFETEAFRFGQQFATGADTLLFTDKLTDISQALDEVYTRFYNRNLGAVVLFTDGIYNKGANPLSQLRKFKNVSFYTVGLGDTVITRDLVLADVLYNKTAYLGNDYPIEVLVQAKKMQGTRAVLVLKENNREIARRDLTVQTANQTLRTSFLVQAKTEGQRKITAELLPADGEFSLKNNALSVYVNVIKNRQKVLILSYAPHPDVAAIKYALENSQNYQVTSVVYQPGAKYNFAQYNLVVLHSLPTGPADEELVNAVRKAGAPVLFVVGDKTGLVSLNKSAGVLNISGSARNPNNSQPLYNANFTSFTLSEKTRAVLGKFPPLAAPFGEYKMAPGANVLFYQKIGTVNAGSPLILFNKDNNTQKTGVICGEGIWQWKMRDFELNQNNEAFNEVVQKTVQYLSVVENKSNFRVTHKNEFAENEPVMFDAELFNENYEPVNDPDVQMEIANEEKKLFKYVFSKTSNTYRLNAGMLPPGEYSYKAFTSFGKKDYVKSGRFLVTAVNNELLRTEADHRLLYQVANTTGGKFYVPVQLQSLVSDIEKNENVSAVSYTEKTLDDLINKKWLIVIPVLLLAIEWFLRKRAGGY